MPMSLVSTNFGGTGDEVSFGAPDVSDQHLGPRTAKKSYVDTFDEEILREGEHSFSNNPGKPEVVQDTGKISAVSGKHKLPQNSETSSSDSSVSVTSQRDQKFAQLHNGYEETVFQSNYPMFQAIIPCRLGMYSTYGDDTS